MECFDPQHEKGGPFPGRPPLPLQRLADLAAGASVSIEVLGRRMFWLQDGALDVLVLLDPMLFGVAGQHQGQSTVTGDVAGSAEAVLQGKDGQHQGGAGVIKHQHASDQAQRGHDRTAGDTGSADGEDAEQHAEQDHGTDAGQLAVEDLGDGHAEEHFRQDRAAQMDVGKQGDAKADHILAQDLALAGAVQSNGQGSGAGHGADSGQVCGTIVAEHFPGVLAGVSACQQIQDRQPDVMADHDDNDDLQERGQLMGDHALIAQVAESGSNALHEAAHAVVGEILNPDSIGIVTIRGNQSCIGGFENGCSTYLKNEEELLNDITKTLAGKAGVSLIYGVMDVNASGDIQNANRLLDLWMTSLAGAGFSEVESANNRMSETRLFSSEAIKAAKMEELYRRAYEILYDNRDFLLAVQKELLEHETLLNSDLTKIRELYT